MSASPNKPDLGSGLIRLEDRTVPAAIGSPWPDASGLTISFAKDGSQVSGVGSTLSKTLNAVAPAAVWQREVLRAFQTWAVQSDVNFGLVSDTGAAFGTTGDLQGDTRFGDVRLGAVPLSAGEGATANPYDWSSGTWSGDVVFSSAAKFAINPPAGSAALDLFTVALHEAGHALGLGHSDDPNSVMYERYLGPRAGLSAGDVAALRSLYGERAADRYEGAGGNNSAATAAPLAGGTTVSLTADIRTAADADYYSFVVPAGSDKAKVRLYTSGVSLLVGQIQVLDSTGRVLQSAVATDPTAGDLKIDLDHLTAGAKYYVRVASATSDVFGVGGYQLKVGFRDEPNADAKYLKDDGADDARGGATTLDLSDDAPFRAVLESRTDVDWYRLTAPADSQGQAALVSVRGAKADGAPPALTAYDADGNPLLTQFLQSDARGYTVQVSGVAAGGAFYLRLAAPAGVDKVTDNYRLKVNFAPPQGANLDPLAMGQLNQQLTTSTGGLSVSASGLFQFYLSSGSLPDVPGGSLTLTVTDAKGRAVLTLTASSTQPAATGAVYLAAGSYTVTVTLTVPKGLALTNVGFDLLGGLGSDPIGTYAPAVGSPTSPPPPPPPGYVYTGTTTARPTGSTYTF